LRRAAGFFAAGFFAAGFFAAGLAAALAAGFAAGFAAAATATVVSTIFAPAASFCTDATPDMAARFVSYASLDATTWPLVDSREKRNLPVGPFLMTNFPGMDAFRSEVVVLFAPNGYRRGGGRRRSHVGPVPTGSCNTGRVESWSFPELVFALVVASAFSLGTFAHADRHGSEHATAWGIGAFLAAAIVVPVYFVRYWLSKRKAA
jgi:hypothetical protein